MSLSAWERGLKLHILGPLDSVVVVALRVGAWIETTYKYPRFNSALSLSAWERGLKLRFTTTTNATYASLSAWERGLKL